jgi:hypothetical protein
MPLQDPSKNIESIISLVRNAREFVILVSPYSNLTGWDELKAAIKKSSAKTEVSYYVRAGEGLKGLEDLPVNVYEVPMLHTKMFFSEREAIIASFHLINSPDINWAYKLNTRQEYNDLVDFFERYIRPLAKPFNPQIPGS